MIPMPELRHLSRRRSPWRSLVAIGGPWFVIAVAVAVVVIAEMWWLYPLAVVVIAGRQHALAVLVHEGAHGLLCQDRRWNDAMSDGLVAFPLLVSTELYRRHHFRHHRALNSPDDPDVDEVSGTWSRARWWCAALLDVSGLQMLGAAKTAAQWSVPFALLNAGQRAQMSRGTLVGFGLVATLAALSFTVLNGWLLFVAFWLVPMLTVLNFLFRIRSAAEHVGCAMTSELEGSRTVLAGPVARALIGPFNIGYHAEHHLYPSVPYHNLPALHRRLMDDPTYAARIHLNEGYLWGPQSLLTELTHSSSP